MAKTSDKYLDSTKRLMATLGRMPPKPHDQMKIKSKAKKAKSPRQKWHAAAKPKTA